MIDFDLKLFQINHLTKAALHALQQRAPHRSFLLAQRNEVDLPQIDAGIEKLHAVDKSVGLFPHLPENLSG